MSVFTVKSKSPTSPCPLYPVTHPGGNHCSQRQIFQRDPIDTSKCLLIKKLKIVAHYTLFWTFPFYFTSLGAPSIAMNRVASLFFNGTLI